MVGGQTALDREYDRTIEEELEGIDDPLNNGIRPRFRPKKGKPRAEFEPSPACKSLMGTAQTAYHEGSVDRAIELFTEVIRIDPNLRLPWYTLATIWETEKGDAKKGLKFQIIATHLMPVKRANAEWSALGARSK